MRANAPAALGSQVHRRWQRHKRERQATYMSRIRRRRCRSPLPLLQTWGCGWLASATLPSREEHQGGYPSNPCWIFGSSVWWMSIPFLGCASLARETLRPYRKAGSVCLAQNPPNTNQTETGARFGVRGVPSPRTLGFFPAPCGPFPGSFQGNGRWSEPLCSALLAQCGLLEYVCVST